MREEFTLTFQSYDQERERSLVIPADAIVGEACEYLRSLLGLPSSTAYYLGMVRTGTILDSSFAFAEAGIQQNDRLIIIPSNLSQEWKNKYPSHAILSEVEQKKEQEQTPEETNANGAEYQLLLSIHGSKELVQYSVKLEEVYEDAPLTFFEIPEGKEYQKFKSFLQKRLQKEVSDTDLSRVLREWCKDIMQGYRTVSVQW